MSHNNPKVSSSYDAIKRVLYNARKEAGTAMVSSVITTALLTPANNFLNRAMAGNPYRLAEFLSQRAFYGMSSYCMATVPSYVVTFSVRTIIYQLLGTSDEAKLISTWAAGGTAGLVSLPFETIAQARQLNNMSAYTFLQHVTRHHGVRGLFYGAGANTVQYLGWSTAFFWGPETIAKILADTTDLSATRSLQIGAGLSGFTYGVMTPYVSLSRLVMQQHSMLPSKPPSYREIVPQVFKGHVPVGNVLKQVNPARIALYRGGLSALSVFTFTQVQAATKRVLEAFDTEATNKNTSK